MVQLQGITLMIVFPNKLVHEKLVKPISEWNLPPVLGRRGHGTQGNEGTLYLNV